MRFLFALLVLQGADDESPYLRRDLDGIRAEYLVVAPPRFVDALDPLCAHRARTYRVAVVRTDDVAARHGAGPDGIARLVEAVKPRFLLLAGDADAVPTYVVKSAYTSTRFPGDPDLATDHLFGGICGRLPADTPEELGAMIEKTVEYETALPRGRWQKKVSFVTGRGGFGTLVDAVIEKHFNAVITTDLPPAYDLELAYTKPSSPYCFYPPDFNGNTIRLINEGPLFFTYIGHGLREKFDDIPFKDEIYPVLRIEDAGRVEVRRGRPVMVVLACDTGEFDSRKGDCIGEELMKRRAGPVAYIGGSRITQPYGNALMGRYMVRAAFDPKRPTLGEVFQGAKASVTAPDPSFLRKQADTLAATMQGPGNLEPMRKDVVLHYNLLGDPALRLRRLDAAIEIEASREGRRLVVRGGPAGTPVELRFECARDAFYHPTDLEGDSPAERVGRRYRNANNKVILRTRVEAKEGRFEAEFDLPEKLAPGVYWVKAWSGDAIGAVKVEID